MKNFFKFLIVIFTISAYSVMSQPDDIYWSIDFGLPTGDPFETILVHDDYIYFNEYGRLVRWQITKREYEVLGMSTSGSIMTIVEHNNDMYIGGTFSNFENSGADCLAKWDGVKWDTVVSGINGKVSTICFDENGDLWIGGQFTEIAGKKSMNIAYRKDGVWQELPDLDKEVRCITLHQGVIYAGGDFAHFDSLTQDVSAVVSWNGLNWENVGNIGNHPGAKIFSLKSGPNNELYAGGSFFSAGADTISENVARFDGLKWNSLGQGLNKMVFSIEVFDNTIFAGGIFLTSDTDTCKNISMFRNGQWNEVDGGMSGAEYPAVLCLDTDDNYLYAGGNFFLSGNVENWGLVRLNKEFKWENFQPELRNGTVSAVSVFTVDKKNDILYAGGGFVKTGKVVSYGISKFDGNQWIGCNNGLTPTSNACYSIQAVNDTVYFTGWFNYADGIRLRNVAKWLDPQQTWEPVGNGIEGGDFDLGPLLVVDNIIYVAGNFSTVENGNDTIIVNHITYWDGEKWNEMDGGITNSSFGTPRISKIVQDDSLIYIMGSFNRAGKMEVSNIAAWNHISKEWVESNLTINGAVQTMFVDGDDYYFGGTFSSAGTISSAGSIVKWNKRTNVWSRLDSGVNGSVNGITKWGEDIYICGRFEYASGIQCYSVAKYIVTENKFSPLGSGLHYGNRVPNVSDLIVYKNELYFAGRFTHAGKNASSSNIAKWTLAPVSVENTIPDTQTSILHVSPNPFQENLTISIDMETDDNISLEIFSSKGERIVTIYRGSHIPKRNYQFNSDSLPQGVYFIILRTGSQIFVQQTICIR